MRVRIVAEILAEDPHSTLWASCWAGAHCVPVVDDVLQRQFEDQTFLEMYRMVSPGDPSYDPKAPLMKVRHVSYFDERPRQGLGGALLRGMPDFEELHQLPEGAVEGFTFETVTIDTPNYLRWLSTRFSEAGGTYKRARVSHLRDILNVPGPKIAAVINATGLGASSIGGIADDTMYPIRGQTVLIRAPWLTRSYGRSGSSATETTYIIPRASGEVILGGCTEEGDFHEHPRPETSRGIKERCLALCRDILPPDKRSTGQIEDLDVIREGCGLRPARRGGVRCEAEYFESTLIIHATGFAGAGYQSSLGCANYVCELLKEALQ